ncbi:MAG: tRNA (adenosine(37)-N6)-threonylcarbamoyltransferase complex dimerization subunit type 1 TsaB [Bacteroidia bacterium]|nr:tRNA (adenosine(37)-N6)-threonylcarbamoyltransferase complex dimerization subunit type 1 TsaB [Bacteroidia bacterium]MCX7651858.1 tRNA (adenosine(37)-N6)-threonylcarbamoyltransferase complex dimerization subunit type 1 TsaB [Bacteroidia bacterium]MDW8415992.1 tRNA (adenosine(37)-N6)-threonylcarbamoyltransferase complex dimerization subunit type 1 TsaB [Bacteroidia bacterium]
MDGWGLVVETASASLQLGLLKDKVPFIGVRWDADYQHGEKLVVLTQQLIHEAGIEWRDIQYVVYHQGPGSHTGLRIGLTAVKAWSLSLGWHLYCVPLMYALYQWAAKVLPHRDRVFTFWETKKALWYGQLWNEGIAETTPMLLSAQEWAEKAHDALWVGNHPEARLYLEEISWKLIADAAHTLNPRTTPTEIAEAVPLYFREFIPTQRKA